MSVAKRSSGRWIVKFKNEQGLWKQRSFKTEAEARAFNAEMEYEDPDNGRLTVKEAVMAYLQNNPVCETTMQIYTWIVLGNNRRDGTHREGPAEFLKDRFIDTLDRRDLENLRLNAREQGMSDATINVYSGKLEASFNWCAGEDMLDRNPWQKYRKIKGVVHKSRKTSLEDFQKVYKVCPPWLQWACDTAYALCLRPGLKELFALTWDAFDFRSGTVEVYMTKVSRSKTVYPPAWYMEKARPRHDADVKAGEIYVCRSAKGKRVGDWYRKSWLAVCDKAGVPRFPMYAIRHLAASAMLAASADFPSVAAQMGHSTPQTTMSIYAHTVTGGQKAVSAGLVPIGADLVHDGAENKEKDE